MTGPTTIATGRLLLSPAGWPDMEDLVTLKGDPLTYAQMLGGVRSRVEVAVELAADTTFWARHGVGMWLARPVGGGPPVGLVGIHERTDGRGLALRFAFTPASRGRGLAREAAGAALRFAHDEAGLPRIVAVAREDNIGSRTVLGAVGMREAGTFERGGYTMLIYESVRTSRASPPDPSGPRHR